MPNLAFYSSQAEYASPDYPGLVEFLISPFLEAPDSLSVDCEQANQSQRIWIRLAFESADKGRVYGRGGRNLQAIRTVLETAAKAAGQSLYLDIYETQTEVPRPKRQLRNESSVSKPTTRRKHRTRRSAPTSKFIPKPRFYE